MKKRVIYFTLIVVLALMILSMVSFADACGRGNFAGKQGTPNHQGQSQYTSGRFGINQGDNFKGIRNLELSSEQNIFKSFDTPSTRSSSLPALSFKVKTYNIINFHLYDNYSLF